MKRTYKDGDRLTDDEMKFIFHKGRCPDCETGRLLEGPSGGISTNFRCDNCSSNFNFHGYGQFGIDRVSDSSLDSDTFSDIDHLSVEERAPLPVAKIAKPGLWQRFLSAFRRAA